MDRYKLISVSVAGTLLGALAVAQAPGVSWSSCFFPGGTCLSASGSKPLITLTDSGFVVAGVVISATGTGVHALDITSVSGAAVNASCGTCQSAVQGTNTANAYGVTGTGFNSAGGFFSSTNSAGIQFPGHNYAYFSASTVATIQYGSIDYCSDCKSILTSGVTAGSLIAGGGLGSLICFLNDGVAGSWRVM